jgi:hypothetical protein
MGEWRPRIALNGIDGATWYTGSGAPSSGTGANGDFYFRTSNSDVYQKISGSWSVIANIKGAQGDPGTNGTDGATWHTGSGAPSSGLGADGDFYLRTDTYDVYLKSGGSWSISVNIKGPQGDPGAPGTTTFDFGFSIPHLAASGEITVNDGAFDTTQGKLVRFMRAVSWTGNRVYWPGGHGDRTMTVTAWKGGSKIATGSTTVNAAGIYEISFASPVAVSGASIGDLYTCAFRDGSRVVYLSDANILPSQPFLSSPYVLVTNAAYYAGGGGDADPNTSAGAPTAYCVEPILASP